MKLVEENNEGTYPVAVQITYKDDLRNSFEEQIDGKVSYTQPVVERSNQDSPIINSVTGVLAGVGVAGVVGFYFVRKKRKNNIAKGKKGGSTLDEEDDMDFLGGTKQ